MAVIRDAKLRCDGLRGKISWIVFLTWVIVEVGCGIYNDTSINLHMIVVSSD